MSATAVESATAQLAATSISNPAEDSAHILSAAEGRRLYIGNLAYSTTEEQLTEFFKGYAV